MEMKCVITCRCFTYFLFLHTVLSEVRSQRATVQPADVTAEIGDRVVLKCTVSGGVAITWTKYGYGYGATAVERIYSSASPGDVSNSAKYEIEGTYNLVVKNLQMEDGATYECHVLANNQWYHANLLVIGAFEAKVEPKGLLSVGSLTMLTCKLTYASTTTDAMNPRKALTPEQEPDLQLFLADIEITTPRFTSPPGSAGVHSRVLTVNHTLTNSDAGKSLKCVVRSMNYEKTTSSLLNMNYSPREQDITIIYNDREVRNGATLNVCLGETIECTAVAQPTPTVVWRPNDETHHVVRSGRLLIEHEGKQTWRCVASNRLGSVSVFINLNVAEKMTCREDSSSTADSVVLTCSLTFCNKNSLPQVGFLVHRTRSDSNSCKRSYAANNSVVECSTKSLPRPCAVDSRSIACTANFNSVGSVTVPCTLMSTSRRPFCFRNGSGAAAAVLGLIAGISISVHLVF